MPNSVLSLRHATQYLSSNGESFELSINELDLERGGISIIVGRSGCGKSTLLDGLGVLTPFESCEQFLLHDRGEDKLLDVTQLSSHRLAQWRRQNLGIIHQTGALIPFLTIRENINLALRLSGRDICPRDLRDWAQRLEIEDQLSKLPKQLSVGQRQRASIARALIHQPSFVLADEPTGALDPHNAQNTKELLIQTIRETGATAMIVTHDAELFDEAGFDYYTFDVHRVHHTTTSSLVKLAHSSLHQSSHHKES